MYVFRIYVYYNNVHDKHTRTRNTCRMVESPDNHLTTTRNDGGDGGPDMTAQKQVPSLVSFSYLCPTSPSGRALRNSDARIPPHDCPYK